MALLTAALLACVVCGRLNGWLRSLRLDGGPSRSELARDLPEVPPLITFTTVALGGFRGVLADILWVRATGLQDEGRFFEIAQLANWITHLEPRIPEVWAYHAWNLAYNVSVMFPDPEDRWRWVQQGVRLLRDQGIPYNARDPRLYWELAWLYHHKIGGTWDDAERIYKLKLAATMESLIPGGLLAGGLSNRTAVGCHLEREHGLALPLMEATDVELGPLDWRLPESFAVYWSRRGREVNPADPWCARVLYQAMREIFRNGRLLYEPQRGLIVRGPRFDLFAKVCAAFERSQRVTGDPTTALAYENFLRDAVLLAYVFGREPEAAAALQRLQAAAPAAHYPPDVEAFVRAEAREGTGNMSPEGLTALVVDLLVQAHEWRAEGDTDTASGYERLARLYWDAGASGRERPAWEALQDLAEREATSKRAGDGDG